MRLKIFVDYFGCLIVGVGLSGCADTGALPPSLQHLGATEQDREALPEQDDTLKPIADPNESFNRAVLEQNEKFNHAVLYPVAKAYNENVPQSARDRVDAFTANLGEPMVFANDVLQLRFKGAATTLGRFALNSTVGMAGLFDVAASQGLAKQSGDFGQTMYVWGYRDSAYLVLPVVGPTNVRDAIGNGVEFAAQMNSGGIIPPQLASAKSAAEFVEDIDPVTDVVDVAGTVTGPLTDLSKAGDMQDLEESSIDFYSMLRSVTQQKRKAELQEALATSVLTATPTPPDPNAIEPVTEIVSSPTLLENRNVTKVPKLSDAVASSGTFVIVGAPVPTSAP
ncbi:MAG: VacJ family lipoprotein [Proteobacteria bacterium]|nr:VacJ family lipoprotein [Pseudomonadota bacterium]